MKIYQLSARGDSTNGWAFRSISKKVFRTHSEAEAHTDEFTKLCEDDTYFECAVPGSVEIIVNELELEDEQEEGR